MFRPPDMGVVSCYGLKDTVYFGETKVDTVGPGPLNFSEAQGPGHLSRRVEIKYPPIVYT